jgi:hypothetical protein
MEIWVSTIRFRILNVFLTGADSIIDFNLDFYTEVQDLSYLENTLNASLSPKYASLNMAMISLIEDFNLVGFETLAIEVMKPVLISQF